MLRLALASVSFLGSFGGLPAAQATWVVRPVETGLITRYRLDAAGGLLAPAPFAPSRPSLRGDEEGRALVEIGDLDGNGVPDLGLGRPGAGAFGQGLVIVTLLAPGGAIQQEVSFSAAAFHTLSSSGFGSGLAALGDVDGDGVPDLAVGEPGTSKGQVWIVFLSATGAPKGSVLISQGLGGFLGVLDVGDAFGASVAAVGDLDGDGVTELAVGAEADDDGGNNRGALWILFLNPDGSVKSEQKISATSGGFTGTLLNRARFGQALAALGDLNGDGSGDLAVGAPSQTNVGDVWVLFLQANGAVAAHTKASSLAGRLGASLALLGDLDGDGRPELAAGAPQAQVVRILSLRADGTVLATLDQVGGASSSGFGGGLGRVSDLNGDGLPELLVGSPRGTLPGDFGSPQEAVNAVAPGDTLLIRGGVYPGPLSIQKPLTLVAERGHDVTVGALGVSSVSAGVLTLRGLEFVGPSRLTSNPGLIWIEDCSFHEQDEAFATADVLLDVQDCSEVVLIGSTLRAEWEMFAADALAQTALELGNSQVQAYDSTFLGALGGDRGPCGGTDCGQDGGPGIRSLGAGDFVFLGGCTVVGGNGAIGDFGGLNCGAGGRGFVSAGTGVVFDSLLEGGRNGCFGGSVPGHSGSVSFLAGRALHFSTDAPVRAGQDLTLRFRGPPLALVYLTSSTRPLAHALLPAFGILLTAGPREVLQVGLTDESGALEIVRSIGPLPVGVSSLATTMQAAYLDLSIGLQQPGLAKHRRVLRTFVLGPGAHALTLAPTF